MVKVICLIFLLGNLLYAQNLQTKYYFLNNPHLFLNLTYPQKMNRPTIGILGYDLKVSDKYFPGLRIGQLLTPGEYGNHNYSHPSSYERNGHIYTCRGGFVDFSHLRAGIDWTSHIALLIDKYKASGKEIQLKKEGGEITLNIQKIASQLEADEILEIAQQVAFLRLTWHEIVSWYYHFPTRLIAHQRSTLTPEDSYSNLLGTYIGADALKLMMNDPSLEFRRAVDISIVRWMDFLGAVQTKEEIKIAFDHIDRARQGSLGLEINTPPWYDSDISIDDQRYIFKRQIKVWEDLAPWLIPDTGLVDCGGYLNTPDRHDPYTLKMPATSERDYNMEYSEVFDFIVKPDPGVYSRNNKSKYFEGTTIRKYNHRPLPNIIYLNRMDELKKTIEVIATEMEEILGKNFDNRYNENEVIGQF